MESEIFFSLHTGCITVDSVEKLYKAIHTRAKNFTKADITGVFVRPCKRCNKPKDTTQAAKCQCGVPRP